MAAGGTIAPQGADSAEGHRDRGATADAGTTTRPRWWRLGLVALAILGGALAVGCNAVVFPYHSANSDEGSYLTQAETLSRGHLFTNAPAVGTRSFRPWLAVQRNGSFVFKFTPVHAGWLAASDAVFGSPVVALAVIAAADVVLLALLVRALGASHRAALLAGVLLAISPAWFLQSGTYLPYLSGLALLLGAATCVVHGTRAGRGGWFVAAGAVWGLAFFSRQYDAVLLLVAVGVAGAFTLWHNRVPWRTLARRAVWFGVGAAPLLILLGLYDKAATGSALRLPFNLITRSDGIGFGAHRVQPHDPLIYYTPRTAIHATVLTVRDVLEATAGSVLLIGLAAWAVCRKRLPGRRFLLALAGIWVVGFFLFWGTYAVTVLSDINRLLGPIYYMPLIAALVALGALALDELGSRRRALAGVLTASVVVISLGVGWFMARDNLRGTRLRRAAAHEIDRGLPARQRSLLLVTPVRGPFVGHPMSWLRNDPDGRGRRLIAIENPTTDFKLIEHYRFRAPSFVSLINLDPVPSVRAVVERARTLEGPALRLHVSGPVPLAGRTRSLLIGLDGGGKQQRASTATSVTIEVRRNGSGVAVTGLPAGMTPMSEPGDTSALTVSFHDLDANGVTHVASRRIPLRSTGGQTAALLPGLQLVDDLGRPLEVRATALPR